MISINIMRIPNIEKGTKVLYAILVPTLHFTILRVRLILLPIIREIKVAPSLIMYRFQKVFIIPVFVA